MKNIKKLVLFFMAFCPESSLYSSQVKKGARHIPQTYVMIQGKTQRGKAMFFTAQSKTDGNFFFLRVAPASTKEELINSLGVNLKDGKFDKYSSNGIGDTLHVFNVGRIKVNPQSPSRKINMKWFNLDRTLDNISAHVGSGLGFIPAHGFSACNLELIHKAFFPTGFGTQHATDGSSGATCVNPRPWEK